MSTMTNYEEEFRRIIRLIEAHGELKRVGYVILDFEMGAHRLVVDHRGPELPVLQIRTDPLENGRPIHLVTLCVDGTLMLPGDIEKEFDIRPFAKFNKHNILNRWIWVDLYRSLRGDKIV